MSKQPYDGIAGVYDANRASYPPELMEQFRDLWYWSVRKLDKTPVGGLAGSAAYKADE